MWCEWEVALPFSFLIAESHTGGQKLGVQGVATVFWRKGPRVLDRGFIPS